MEFRIFKFCCKFSSLDCSCLYFTDPIAPSFLSCPADIVAYEDEIIYWDEPTALDNVGIPYLWSSADQGYTFDVGITTVTYTALDYDDNKAICEFDVIVYSEGKII